ncbi:MAG: carbohydrate-binding family 9-like protein [Acidobacteria bacterium]|nr:carbohydrate-binding family 9-like protein [Acidobacteriota bacterium]
MSGTARPSLNVKSIASDFAVSDLSNAQWKRAERVTVDRYWSDFKAPKGRRFAARLLWSKTALYIRFEANQEEPLVVTDKPDLTKKAMNLWDRDVCEIFVAPDRSERRKYFEFEVAPTGEWLDVALDLTSGTRVSEWKYSSKMESSSRVESGKVVMAIKIPWNAFGKTPKAGDVWLGNLLRCVGKDPGRGYLAWQPTLTKEPAFHVPEKFGEFRFMSEPAA